MPEVSRLRRLPSTLRELVGQLSGDAPAPASPAPGRQPSSPQAPVARDRREVSAGAGAQTIGKGQPRSERFALRVDLVANRIYVVNKATGKPIDKFLTSPGTADHPTEGDKFVIKGAYSLPTWYPPKSKWAEGLKPVGPGPNNPLGLLAIDLGGYSEFIHGVGRSKYPLLGQPASHGCLRMSNENVLLLYSKYIAKGVEVEMVRDPQESQRLRAQAAANGVRERSIEDGAEFYANGLKGKLPPID